MSWTEEQPSFQLVCAHPGFDPWHNINHSGTSLQTSTQKVELGTSGVQGHPQLRGAFKVILRPFLQNNRKPAVDWQELLGGRQEWAMWHWMEEVAGGGGDSFGVRRGTRQSGGRGSDVLCCPLWMPVGTMSLSS